MLNQKTLIAAMGACVLSLAPAACAQMPTTTKGASIAEMKHPMMNPNSYIQMFNPALGLMGMNPVGNIAAIDPNTYVQLLVQLLGGLHAGQDTSEGFLDKLKELGEQVAPSN